MVNTKHINKNGLSFDCPDYYDIGMYPDSDEVYESIVALSKQDRKCELYVMVYRKNMFDDAVKRDEQLIWRHLQLQGYDGVHINNKLPYCFHGSIAQDIGSIDATITFKFGYNKNVIMIVGNSMPFVHYDFIEDIKIILDTVEYNKKDLNNLYENNNIPEKIVDIEKRNKIFHKGLEYEESGEYFKAFETYCEALSYSPEKEAGTSLIYAIAASIAYYKGGTTDLAIIFCKKGIKADVTRSANYELLGNIYLDLDEPEKAMKYLKQAEILAQNEK